MPIKGADEKSYSQLRRNHEYFMSPCNMGSNDDMCGVMTIMELQKSAYSMIGPPPHRRGNYLTLLTLRTEKKLIFSTMLHFHLTLFPCIKTS